MKILIHDGRTDALEFLLESIVNHGFNAGIAEDGPMVIDMLSDERYNIILTNGNFLKINLDQYFGAKSKSVFIIDIRNTKEQNEAMESKVDMCLQRPFEASKLWQTIASNIFRT